MSKLFWVIFIFLVLLIIGIILVTTIDVISGSIFIILSFLFLAFVYLKYNRFVDDIYWAITDTNDAIRKTFGFKNIKNVYYELETE